MNSFARSTEVVLPHGFAGSGEWRRKVWLRPWDGTDAECCGGKSVPPAAQVSAILARCVSLDGAASAGPEFARSLCIGDREALLLHLLSIFQGDKLECVLTCPACREKMDLKLQVAGMLLPPYPDARSSYAHTVVHEEGEFQVLFRLPNGDDQESVAQLAEHDISAAASAMLQRCIKDIDGQTAEEVPAAVAEALPNVIADLDPQAELLLDATCPDCEARFEALFDGAAFVLPEIEQAWKRLHHEVHILASHYHWAEADILSMNDMKRRMYLELIGEEFLNQREYAS